ncbi:MAG: lipid A biosynthesis acyltransferase [Flavobacteriaceae bacterium]|nr:lipid A biosynthesis acyltransferase [Flavobacteriaceae bacterium]
MQFLIFILIYPFIWLISLLPLKILYLISDFFFVLIYFVFGYRKKVIYINLKLAFPEKSTNELKVIRKKFYMHFVDIFIEMIKSFTISEKQLKKRYIFTNIELLQELEKEGKSIMLMGSHYANWEWVFILNKYVNSQGVAAFSKINNVYFDKKIRLSRARLGTTLVITSKLIELLVQNKNNNIQTIYGLLNDQSPQAHRAKYWSEFMGIKVPMQTGAEFLAKKHDFIVIMVKTKKVKRGYFESEIKLLTKTPKEYKDYEITDLFTKELEKQIKEKPEHYFWSHKRFKHRNKAPNKFK